VRIISSPFGNRVSHVSGISEALRRQFVRAGFFSSKRSCSGIAPGFPCYEFFRLNRAKTFLKQVFFGIAANPNMTLDRNACGV
jgi:hypothetical protein